MYKFEQDVLNDKRICEMVSSDETFAREMYASLCNVIWENKSLSDKYAASWRHAGYFVSSITGRDEDYLDYYLGGGEGRVSLRVESEMKRIGWSWRLYTEDETI